VTDRHPEIAPLIRGTPASDTAIAMSIRYASVGATAAIETWLLRGDLDDIELAVDMLLSTSPSWWLGRSA
jgi:hypothetical protein